MDSSPAIYIGVGAAYLLLFWNQSHFLPVDLSVTALSVGGIIGLVLVRQIMALNENSKLYLAAKREIDERKVAEEALKISENRYRAIFETTGMATVILEEDTIISLANAEFENLTGYTKDEIEGTKSWTDFVVKDDLERMKTQHRLRRENPDIALGRYEFRLSDKNDQTKNILLNVGLIPGTRKSIASLLDIKNANRWKKLSS